MSDLRVRRTLMICIIAMPFLTASVAGAARQRSPDGEETSPAVSAPDLMGSDLNSSVTEFILSQPAPLAEERVEIPVTGGFSLAGGVAGSAESELDSSEGDFTLSEVLAGVTYRTSIGWMDHVMGLARIKQLQFDFNDTAAMGDPSMCNLFEDVSISSIGVVYLHIVDERWGYGGAVISTFAGESGAEDQGSVAAIPGAYYRWPKVTLGVVIVVAAGLENTAVFPYPIVQWRITDRFTLKTKNGVIGEYRLSLRDRLSLSCLYDTDRFRLDDEPIDPLMQNGIVSYKRGRAAFEYQHSFTMSTFVRASASSLFAQEFDLKDQDGEDVRTVDAGNSWRLGIEGGFSF